MASELICLAMFLIPLFRPAPLTLECTKGSVGCRYLLLREAEMCAEQQFQRLLVIPALT